MRIAVFGLGYVGSVTLACLAELGHAVIGVDVQDQKVHTINSGRAPVKEPGLGSMMERLVRKGLIRATRSTDEAVSNSDLAVICVGTPSEAGGKIDGSQVSKVVNDLSSALETVTKQNYRVLNRSTCLPGLHRTFHRELTQKHPAQADYIVHPEFLREGSAVSDFLTPPTIVFGSNWHSESSLGREIYPGIESPTIYLSMEEAALVKYASNIFHAVKITFANEIGLLSSLYQVDARRVMDVVCQDRVLNISERYLKPGLPFGGSCLPKDLGAVIHHASMSAEALPMLTAVLESNDAQVNSLLGRLQAEGFSSVALVGLAFKKHTDDLRNSPLVHLANRLVHAGFTVSAWDPLVRLEDLTGANAEYLRTRLPGADLILKNDLREAVRGVDAVVIGQKIDRATLEALRLTPDQTVFDLVGCITPTLVPGRYEGLYWGTPLEAAHDA